jgi:hypothetical protein
MEFLDTVEFPPVFDGPERTSRDREVARQLMHLVKNGQLSVPPNSTHALLFACDLLAEEDETELGELLASPDDYVREHVLLRLNRSANSRCRKLVDEHNSAFGAFIERCVTFLKAQGITAVIHDHGDRKAVSLEPGPIWLNMEMFYARRDEAGFEDLFLDRVRSFLEGDKPKTKKKKKK